MDAPSSEPSTSAAQPRPPSASASWRERLVPPADKPVAGWHVSPFVDLAAYHFSWLWILVPLALAGDMHPKDYLGLWAFGMTLSFLHRHYTMPYVYLDKGVFGQHVTRFTLFFYLLMLGFLASAFLYKWKSPPGFYQPVDLAVAAGGIVLAAQCIVADKRGLPLSVLAMIGVAAPYTIAVGLGIGGVYVAQHTNVAQLVLAMFVVSSVLLVRELKQGALFTVVLAALLIAGAASVGLGSPALAQEAVKGSAVVGIVGVVAAVWNVWHTLMQKFGILRVYAAKSAVPVEKRTPPWVDRLLIFGTFPFLALAIGPAQRDVIKGQSKAVTQYLMPVIDGIEVVQVWLLVPAGLFAAFSVGCFFWHEWRADRFACTPRLSMAIALTLLNASFLVLSPLKVYIAYGFSHAIEYMVFVWAFLRRRYAQPLPHRPLIQRALTRPVLSYLTFSLVIALAFFLVEYADDFQLHKEGLVVGGVELVSAAFFSFTTSIRPFDIKPGIWLFSFAIWHSLAHFYFDGFLWKMRAASVRASL